jgi:hypothetical protein
MRQNCKDSSSPWRIERRRGRVVAIQDDLIVLGLVALDRLDHEQAMELMDPSGAQRRFCEQLGIEPTIREQP